MSHDIQKEISELYREASKLNARIGRLESAVKHGTALPTTEPFDFHKFVERIALPTLETSNDRQP